MLLSTSVCIQNFWVLSTSYYRHIIKALHSWHTPPCTDRTIGTISGDLRMSIRAHSNVYVNVPALFVSLLYISYPDFTPLILDRGASNTEIDDPLSIE